MTAEAVRHCTKLKRLVNISALPPAAQEESRSGNIFGQRSLWEAADLFQCTSANDVSRSCTPGHAQSIFDWFRHMHKEVKTLAEWITGRYVVEKLDG